MKLLVWVSVFLLLLGCVRDKEQPSVPLRVNVFNERKKPVSGVTVFLDGKVWRRTDETGHLQKMLPGPEGRVVGISIQCPQGTVAQGGTKRDLLVRFLRPIDGGENVPLSVAFNCFSPTRKSVLLVRTQRPVSLPVHALGRQVAATDDNGIATVVIEGVPGDEIEVLLDTTAHPRLRPAMPSRRLLLPASRQIFVFDQTFETQRSRRKRMRRRRYSGPRRI